MYTQFGCAVANKNGKSRTDSIKYVAGLGMPMRLIRSYDNGGGAKAAAELAHEALLAVPNARLFVSYHRGGGSSDADVTALAKSLPTDRNTKVAIHHEVDTAWAHMSAKDQAGFAEQFKTDFAHHAGVLKEANSYVKPSFILTGFDYDKRMAALYPGPAAERLGVDPYVHSTKQTMEDVALPLLATAQKYAGDTPLYFTETGCVQGVDPLNYINSMGWAIGKLGGVCWFDSDGGTSFDYSLDKNPNAIKAYAAIANTKQ